MLTVRHLPSLGDPRSGTMTRDAWVYRTEVENTGNRRLRVIWFEFYYQNDGTWFGVNVRNRPLGNSDFVDWYGDSGSALSEGGWLEPGAVGVCDPNWHLAFCKEPYPAKWSFLAVDEEGRECLAEAEIPGEVVKWFSVEKEE
ncbi:MAG: hypothetical protein KDL87_09195 [Verrucomicrobiae bacterium]|nr:hypothetical protein [Verrucomicrobiae bacterium]